MTRRPFPAVLALSAFALAALAGPAAAQPRVDHPKLRAALHEMREARQELRDARDAWPPGYKERAERSIDDAIQSVRTILRVQNVDSFRGVDRTPDYYRRYANHPRLRAALSDLREARDELRDARGDAGNLKERALDDIDRAVGDILTLMRNDRR